MIHTVKGFGIANETDVSLEFPNFLYDPMNVGILISGSSSFSKSSWGIWKFLDCIVLKPSMQDFKHGLTSMGDECNCPMVSTFFSIYSIYLFIYLYVCVCVCTHTVNYCTTHMKLTPHCKSTMHAMTNLACLLGCLSCV